MMALGKACPSNKCPVCLCVCVCASKEASITQPFQFKHSIIQAFFKRNHITYTSQHILCNRIQTAFQLSKTHTNTHREGSHSAPHNIIVLDIQNHHRCKQTTEAAHSTMMAPDFVTGSTATRENLDQRRHACCNTERQQSLQRCTAMCARTKVP